MSGMEMATWAAAAGTALTLLWMVVNAGSKSRPKLRLGTPRIENRPMIIVGRYEHNPVWDTLAIDLVNRGQSKVTVDKVQVERPVLQHDPHVDMAPRSKPIEPGEKLEYTLAVSQFEDGEADRTHPVRFVVRLAGGDVFRSDKVALTGRDASSPRLRRVR
ncbi:MAG: hypothetical protein KY440_12950 [Actinobacteria bacterium]|nr:hypothetical protein [Actinomycetota bacterium]